MQVEHADVVGRLQIPQSNRVVPRAAYKLILGRTQSNRRDRVSMALEVADVRVVVGGEEANGVVDLCAGVDDALCMVAEARKVYSILLTLKLLCVLAFLAVVDLKGIVVARYNG